MKMLANRIKYFREVKNYSQEYVANQLGIAQNSYSKLETGKSAITTERLMELAKILEVSAEQLLKEDAPEFNLSNNHIEKFYGYIEHLQEDNKEITNTTLRLLEEQIKYLQEENGRLLKTIESLIKK
ncbi:MAG: helix-turn-helix domain-containing protein [Chitinophagales bacterium]|nr:helix-turn-helix domain-containing protein [Chitinophagales bacterium]